MSSANQHLEQDVVLGNMLLQNFNFEVRQCCDELFIVQADSIASRVAVPPRYVFIVCYLADRAQYSLKVMLVFEPNMFVHKRETRGLPIVRNRCCCHTAPDLAPIS